jgi:hypothetical protein
LVTILHAIIGIAVTVRVGIAVPRGDLLVDVAIAVVIFAIAEFSCARVDGIIAFVAVAIFWAESIAIVVARRGLTVRIALVYLAVAVIVESVIARHARYFAGRGCPTIGFATARVLSGITDFVGAGWTG